MRFQARFAVRDVLVEDVTLYFNTWNLDSALKTRSRLEGAVALQDTRNARDRLECVDVLRVIL